MIATEENRSFLVSKAIALQSEWQASQNMLRLVEEKESAARKAFAESLEELARKEPDTLNHGQAGGWMEHHLRSTLGWSQEIITAMRRKGAKKAVTRAG